MIKLRTLVILQALFAAASLAYLLASAWRKSVTGDPLSAAPLAPSVILFLIYVGCLFLPRFGHYRWYRIAMGLAVLFFGGGGVLGNIIRYIGDGLAQYATFGAWALAVAINAYGTALNIMAVLGLYRQQVDRSWLNRGSERTLFRMPPLGR